MGTAAKRRAQLRQAADGFVYRDDGTAVRLKHRPKIDAVIEWVEGLGEPVVLFAAFTESVRLLADLIPGAVTMVGADQTGAELFKAGAARVLICQGSYSEGLNLQGVCRAVGIVSATTKPTDMSQGIARVRRTGQRLPQIVRHFHLDGSRDARIYQLIKAHDGKLADIEELIDAT